MLNPTGLRDYASILADAVGSVLDGGDFPIVLGGDCTTALGNALVLKRRRPVCWPALGLVTDDLEQEPARLVPDIAKSISISRN